MPDPGFPRRAPDFLHRPRTGSDDLVLVCAGEPPLRDQEFAVDHQHVHIATPRVPQEGPERIAHRLKVRPGEAHRDEVGAGPRRNASDIVTTQGARAGDGGRGQQLLGGGGAAV